MKLLFSPAELLMNRLSYPIKFGVLGLLVFLAFASLMLTLAGQLNRTIERAESELVATALARPLSSLIELTQQHRGVSAMLLGGNTAMADRRSALQTRVDTALVEMVRHWPRTSAARASGRRSVETGMASSGPCRAGPSGKAMTRTPR